MFQDLANNGNPTSKDLLVFVGRVREFLGFIIEGEKFEWLWDELPDGIRDSAKVTYRQYVAEGVGLVVDKAIPEIDPKMLELHGLVSTPQYFKFQVIAHAEEGFKSSLDEMYPVTDDMASKIAAAAKRAEKHRWYSVRDWFKKLIAAIDATLDSILKCVDFVMPGAGGILKEIKDAVMAIV